MPVPDATGSFSSGSLGHTDPFSGVESQFAHVEHSLLVQSQEVQDLVLHVARLTARVDALEAQQALLLSRLADTEQDVELASTRLAVLNHFLHSLAARVHALLQGVLRALPRGF